MEEQRKVFVANKSAHNYMAAGSFGELVYVTEGTIDRYDANGIWRAWQIALDGSHPDDYIMPTSLNIICMIGAALFAVRHRRLNLLLFRYGKYVTRELVFHEDTPTEGTPPSSEGDGESGGDR
jgi:hypothetical protein